MPTNDPITAAVAPVADRIVANVAPSIRVTSDRGSISLAHTGDCAAQHFSPWMIEQNWFRSAVDAVKAGTLAPKTAMSNLEEEPPPLPYKIHDGVAVISIAGAIMKKRSKYGGTSSVEARHAIRKAVKDETVHSILLHIDSPGGTVAGTADLAADVSAADDVKPVYAHIDDLGASAAYWVASQARRITANATGEVGCIGTLLVLADTSGMYAAEGIKVHVISTGKFKGAGVDGAPITPEQLAMFQEEVDDLNEHFLKGVSVGRGMPMAKVRDVADGRVHIAAKAKALGLIDDVVSLEVAFTTILKDYAERCDEEPEATQTQTTQAPEVSRESEPAISHEELHMATEASTQAAPAQTSAAVATSNDPQSNPPNPTPPVSPRTQELETLRNATEQAKAEAAQKRGFDAGAAAATKRLNAIAAACPGHPQMAIDAFLAGQTPEAVKLAFEAAEKVRLEAAAREDAHNMELARLRAQLAIGGHPGIDMDYANVDDDGESHVDPKVRAEQEWDQKPSVRKGFSGKANYVAYRVRELQGSVQRQVASA